MSQHILIVDDDRRIRDLLKSFLSENDYLVTGAANAIEARAALQGLQFDLMILDVMMPGETGLSLAENLRVEKQDLPILMLSALSSTDDRVKGLETGIDDYLGKPFNPAELLLRIKSLLRRSKGTAAANDEFWFGPFSFNSTRGELRRNTELIKLTTRERDMLRILINRNGEPASRLDLSGEKSDESARAVDVQINRLRQKIEADPSNPRFLQTVRGAGYVLHVEAGKNS